jgi:hypothetical protein
MDIPRDPTEVRRQRWRRRTILAVIGLGPLLLLTLAEVPRGRYGPIFP